MYVNNTTSLSSTSHVTLHSLDSDCDLLNMTSLIWSRIVTFPFSCTLYKLVIMYRTDIIPRAGTDMFWQLETTSMHCIWFNKIRDSTPTSLFVPLNRLIVTIMIFKKKFKNTCNNTRHYFYCVFFIQYNTFNSHSYYKPHCYILLT